MMMKKILAFVLIAIGSLAVSSQPASADVSVGDKPKINWEDVDGKKVTNEAIKGRIIIVDFWATWCGPCMAEADHMVQLNKEYGPKGVNIIGVSLDKDIKKMKKVAKDKGFNWPQVCDGKGWDNAVAKEWGVDSIPRTFILSPDGEVLWTGHPASIDEPLAEIVKKHGKEKNDKKK